VSSKKMADSSLKKKLIIAGAGAALFVALCPGHLLSLPPADEADGTKGDTFLSGKVDVRSCLTHGMIFAGGLFGIMYAYDTYSTSSSSAVMPTSLPPVASVESMGAARDMYATQAPYAMSTYATLPANVW
jgi:hypothetical protein